MLRSLRGGSRVIGFVLVAVFAQIFRNWMLLHAVGVDASFFDAIAVLIAVVDARPASGRSRASAPRPRCSSSAATGSRRRRPPGVLMTVTGTVGGLCFAAWAGADRLWSRNRRGLLVRTRAGQSQAR